jgi:hypothetical protein
MNKPMRDEILREFTNRKEGEPGMILLASLRCAAFGLNLQVANNVHMVVQWWNGAIEEQFKRRVARAGQKRKLRFFYYILRGTIEELVVVRGGEKSDLISAVIGGNDGVVTTSSNFSRPDIGKAHYMTFEQGDYGPTAPPRGEWPEKTLEDLQKLPQVALGRSFASISLKDITGAKGGLDNTKLARVLTQEAPLPTTSAPIIWVQHTFPVI